MNISSSSKLYAVFGHPVKHSLSPRMQNAALRAMGLNAVYLAFDVCPERLMDALKTMEAIGCGGINLTVPLKEVAFRGISELDASARSLGSVNTVKFGPEGMQGFSTDGQGFILALNEAFSCSPRGLSVFMLGCGGAGRAVALACSAAGAAKIYLADNEPLRPKKLKSEIEALGGNVPVEIVAADRSARNRSAQSAELIVQATPVGMRNDDVPPMDADAFNGSQMVFDLIYMFPETGLMRMARTRKARVANGLDMLLFQGALALSIWTGLPAPIEIMRKALKEAVYGA